MEKKKQSKMRLGVLSGIALLLIISLLVGACAKAPATPAPGTPVATPTPTAVKPIVLKYLSFNVKTDSDIGSRLDQWWLEEMRKRTGGRVQFDEYYAGALGTIDEAFVLASKGAIDLVGISPSRFEAYLPWDIPTNTIYHMIKSPKDAVRIERTLMNEFPVFQSMWLAQNLKFVYGKITPEYGFVSSKLWTTLADVKGKKMYTWGNYVPKILQAAGAVAVSVPAADSYDAISKGLLDGAYAATTSIITRKYYEVAKYMLDIDAGSVYTNPLCMNLDRYNAFPDDIRRILDQLNLEAYDKVCALYDEFEPKNIAFLKSQGVQYHWLPDAEIKQIWDNTGNLLYDVWVKDMEKKGGQGAMAKKIADRITQLAAPGWAVKPKIGTSLEPKP